MKPIHLSCVAVLVLLILGCSGGSSGGGSTEDDGAASNTLSLTGTQLSGTISTLSARMATRAAPAESYTVVAISNKTYRTTTDTDGTFALDLPADVTFTTIQLPLVL